MQDHDKTKTDFFWSQTGPVLREEEEEEDFIYHKLIRQIIRHIAKISMEGCRN